jgi:hydroxymethylglutaryl-CoA lyase
MVLPMVYPRPGMPARVTVYEVGPRDGLQNEAAALPASLKVEFARRLLAAGLTTVELTSFVPRSWVPQLGDAEEVMDGLGADARGPGRPVLVPNERGLDRALEAGAQAVAIFASATESFAQRNVNRSVEESMTMFAPVIRRAQEAGLWVRGYVSMCFGDPWEGPVAPAQVARVGHRLLELGVDQLSLGDTIGVGTPGHVEALLDELAARGVGPEHLAVHFHDTYGQALANTVTAMGRGISTVDASAGGLGGCPYARSATGNLATEDLIWALNGLGIEHGVDLQALVRTSVWMSERLARPSPSAVVRALADADEPPSVAR